jgi:hypothetical protein
VVRAAPAGTPRRGRGSLLWLQGLVCGALLTFATPTALLLGVLMAPAAAAWLADTLPGRPVARAVAVAGLAPALGPVWHLWLGGHTIAVALELLSDPAAIGIAWVAAACGWAMCQVLPVVLRTLREMREAARAKALAAELELQKEEWDLR